MAELPQQQVTRILAIRHGETDWNLASRIQGQRDIALNDTGRWQARRLAHALADETLAAIYASDLQRALETAQALAAGSGQAVVTDTGLRERGFGEFEGLTFSEIERRWPEQSLRWRKRDPQFGPLGGEILHRFYERSVQTVSRLADAHRGQTIAVVAHGGVLDCLYRAATRIELQAPRSWQLGNAGINRLLFTAQGLTLIGWNDVGHLDSASADEFCDGETALKPGGKA
jgi:probable phosphoglycerate mutase